VKLPTPPGGGKLWTVDVEVFQNYFLAVFYNGVTWKEYDHTQFAELREALNDKSLVLAGFNNFGYDDLILRIICLTPNVTTMDLYHASKDIIFSQRGELKSQRVFELQWSATQWNYSIDVFQLLNGKGSLKEWACRSGSALVAESPVDFDLPLPDDRIEEIRRYCRNDVTVTKELLVKNWDRVILRETLAKQFELMQRVYCLSEQGVAQHTFLTLHRKRTGENTAIVRAAAKENPENQQTEWMLTDLISPKVNYVTAEFQAFFEDVKKARATENEKGAWSLSIPSVVYLAGRDFSIGVGGIHTVDKPDLFESTDEYAIIDLDVASYYPSIIIEEGLYPRHIGPSFCEDMRILRDKRLAAKRTGDKKTADALKIVINATFGKLNDKYSPLRSVPDAMRVTVNGQLFLLMLVESLHAIGADIVSANTDGVTIKVERAKKDDLAGTVAKWQTDTRMVLEEVEYSRIFRRDINNYLVVTIDGKVKYKGVMAQDGGKGDGGIVKLAAERYLLDGVPPNVTIANETDIKLYLYYLRSKNGGELYFGDDKIGKSARWYAAKESSGKVIRRLNPATKCRKEGWAIIPHGHCAQLALDITGMSAQKLDDIDLDYYETEAWNLIATMGPK